MFQESAGAVIPRGAHDRAYRRARVAADALGPGAKSSEIAVLEFAEELFTALAVGLCANPPDLRRLIVRIEQLTDVSPVVLGREVLRMPEWLELPRGVAIDVELTLLLAFAAADSVSLWARIEDGRLERTAHVGERDLGVAETRRLARSLFAGEERGDYSGQSVYGTLVDGAGHPPVALIARGSAASCEVRALLVENAAPSLNATLAHDGLLHGEEGSGAAVERTLRRLRFDLHDGPQQDVIMLAEDLRFFGEQLATVIENGMIRERILGRVDDLEARLVALDGDLRRISGSLLSPFLQSEPLPDAVAQVVQAFTTRTHIVPEVKIGGELTGLTDSQQIALLALIREALANIREHSGAQHVTISITAGHRGVDATVVDDGRGFDPETALMKAARDGHLGLVGMHERVRMLGGQTKIDSRPGGPTVISVTLPPAPASGRSPP